MRRDGDGGSLVWDFVAGPIGKLMDGELGSVARIIHQPGRTGPPWCVAGTQRCGRRSTGERRLVADSMQAKYMKRISHEHAPRQLGT
eukprot:760477-Hanusia_phi.AAC.1